MGSGEGRLPLPAVPRAETGRCGCRGPDATPGGLARALTLPRRGCACDIELDGSPHSPAPKKHGWVVANKTSFVCGAFFDTYLWYTYMLVPIW